MCDCLKKMAELTESHIKETHKSKGVKVAEYKKGIFANAALMFGGPIGTRLYSVYELEYIPVKKDGTRGQKKTAKVNLFYNHCPFCGEKVPDEVDTSKPVEGA